jgi:hypothetical protein
MNECSGYNQVKILEEDKEKHHLFLNGEHIPTHYAVWILQCSDYFPKSSYINILKISQ